MQKGNFSRRGFLARSLAALTAGAGLPLWHARELIAHEQEQQGQQRSVDANDRIVMGAIGVGTNYTRRGSRPLGGERGVAIMQEARRQQGVQVVAVCDVDRHNREWAAQLVGNGCRGYSDFRELLANRNINAVTIGTPDHWHALIAIAAMRAGKDVYCEKPLTLTVAEGQALVRVARETGRIVQTGSQQRTEFGGRFRVASELVRNGRIGRVQTIETRIGSNPVGGPFQVRPVLDGLDWNMWLGPTPMVDYIPQRCHYEFRWWYEYSGGKMTDWGAHHNDTAQWALGMDGSGPVEVEVNAATPPAQGNRSYNCHENFRVTYTYANGPNGAAGTRLLCTSRGENGVHFAGDNGRWIFVSRGALRASAPELLTEPLPQNAVRLESANNQMANFISCVRSRRQPICHAEVGHRSCTVCHIGTIAIRMGQRLRWNPQDERFVGDNAAAANRWLSREMRAPWRIEA